MVRDLSDDILSCLSCKVPLMDCVQPTLCIVELRLTARGDLFPREPNYTRIGRAPWFRDGEAASVFDVVAKWEVAVECNGT